MASNRNHTAADERKAIAKAIAWIEHRVGSETGKALVNAGWSTAPCAPRPGADHYASRKVLREPLVTLRART
jgi:hypothetical protein